MNERVSLTLVRSTRSPRWAASRFRGSAIVSITCGLPCGCTNIRTGLWLFSMDHAAWSGSMRKDVPMMSSLAPLKSVQRPARRLWVCGQRKSVAHKPHKRNNSSKQRTYDALQSADIFTRSRQGRYVSPGISRACLHVRLVSAVGGPDRKRYARRGPRLTNPSKNRVRLHRNPRNRRNARGSVGDDRRSPP
jgi:hypothetical protein